MVKFKRIKPSQKPKRRYIAFEVDTTARPSAAEVNGAVHDAVKALYGLVGTANLEAYVVKEKWDEQGKRGLLRVNRKYAKDAITALIYVRKIGQSSANVRTLKTSGSIKKAMMAFNEKE